MASGLAIPGTTVKVSGLHQAEKIRGMAKKLDFFSPF